MLKKNIFLKKILGYTTRCEFWVNTKIIVGNLNLCRPEIRFVSSLENEIINFQKNRFRFKALLSLAVCGVAAVESDGQELFWGKPSRLQHHKQVENN